MNRQSKNNSMRKNKHINCAECGCGMHPSSPSHLHHNEPTDPAKVKGLPPEMRSATPPSVGPDELLDMTRQRQQAGVDASRLDEQTRSLKHGDLVMVCVLVTDHEAAWLPPELRHTPTRFEPETMWVRVLGREGDGAKLTYRGELWGIPLLIDPKKLQVGSPVTFECRHVHSVLVAD